MKKIFSLVLSAVLMFCCCICVKADSSYEDTLVAKGFPISYTSRLATIHSLHPNWQFEPVMITDMNPAYTFDYCVSQEDVGSRNLVTTGSWAPSPFNTAGNANYSPYYDPADTTLYDSGWRKASNAAVRYFLDPRNFLNEFDIFMFETLEYNPAVHTMEQVNSALSGSFMGNYAACDNGMSYARYITECGMYYNVSPVALAARLKQEQGVGDSPLVNGNIGDVLYNYYMNKPDYDGASPVWGSVTKQDLFNIDTLFSYNGYYNFFNIGASGNGRFAIYLNAAKESVAGGWTTKAAAISGGAQKFAQKYVGDHQDTLYFQKFNTDPRSSRNFWGQYMQNIAAALTESRNARNSYYNNGLIDGSFVFKIPVYAGMPDSPCADPAGGVSYYSPTVPASEKLYSLKATVAGGNGFVHFGAGVTEGAVPHGHTVYFSTEPAEGNKVIEIAVNGQAVEVKNDGFACVYSFPMPANNTTVEVKFASKETPITPISGKLYSLKATVTGGDGFAHFGAGATECSVTEGHTVFLATEPAEGSRVVEVSVNGEALPIQNDGLVCVYSFSMPARNTTVEVKFAETEETPRETAKVYKAQVGNFSVKANAENYAATVRRAGFNATVEEINGYTVYAGAFLSSQDAAARVAEIKAKGISAFVAEVTVFVSKYGDINRDGVISAADVVILKRALTEAVTLEGNSAVAADADGDGVIGVKDLLRLKLYLADSSVPLGKT